MKREPNPYSKNPRLTVTSTMSISVPSMVAEDVLDGTDTPVITVDPEVHGRIDAVSEAVELMDTRIDYVASRTELLYGSCVNADRALSDRIDVLELHGTGDSPLTLSGFAGNYKDYDSTVLDYKLGLDFDFDTKQAYLIVKNGEAEDWQPLPLGDGGSSGSTGNANITLGDDINRIEFSKGADCIAIGVNSGGSSSSNLAYYGLIAPYIYNDKTDTYLRSTLENNKPVVQVSSNGSNWATVGGSSSGSSQVSLEVDSYLTSLVPTLEFYDSSNYIGLSNVVEGKAGIGLVLKSAPGGATNAVYPIYTPGLINPSNKDYRLAWLAQNSGEYELKQTTNGGVTWTSLSGGSSSGSSSSGASYLPVSGSVDSLCLYPTHDNATTYLDTVQYASRVLRFGPSSTDIVYGLQTALAAIGIHGTPGKTIIDAGAVQMALVQGATYDTEPHFIWWNNTMSQYSKWEPWKEGGSSSSGSTGGSVTTLTAINTSMHGVQFDSSDQVFININDGNIVRSESNRLVAKNYTSGSVHDNRYPYLEMHGAYSLRWFDGSSTNEIDLTALSYIESSGSSSSASGNCVKFSNDNSLHAVVTRLEGDSLAFMAKTTGNYNSDLSYYALAAPSFYCGEYRDFEFRVVDVSNGSNIPGLQMRYSFGSDDWVTVTGDNGSSSGSAAGVYELGLLDNGNDSGSHMVPLVEETELSVGGGDRALAAVKWSIGPSTQGAKDLSGVYTLMANPLALYDSAYRDAHNSRIKGAVRVVDMHGTICWQRYSYTNKQWEIEPTEEILPDGVTMELLPYSSYYTQYKGRLAKFTSADGTLMATAPGIGLYTGSQSIVACLTAKSCDTSTNKTTWKDYYDIGADSTDNNHYFMDITELIKRRQQLCDIASHLSQIKWLCENTAALYSLIDK